jgi:hypothetical protein
MSMMARFVAITPDQLATIKDTPEAVRGVFAMSTGLPFEGLSDLLERVRRQAAQLVAGMLERLPPAAREQLQRLLGPGESGLPNPGVGDAVLLQLAQRAGVRRREPSAPETTGHGVSLDKAWHGLHYLLCGAPEPAPGPLGQAVFGGTGVGEDQGYGPARYFTTAQVAEIASALQAPGLEQELHARFDAAAMTQLGIYPGGWESDDEDCLVQPFHTLRDFYAAASEAKQTVVTLIELPCLAPSPFGRALTSRRRSRGTNTTP